MVNNHVCEHEPLGVCLCTCVCVRTCVNVFPCACVCCYVCTSMCTFMSFNDIIQHLNLSPCTGRCIAVLNKHHPPAPLHAYYMSAPPSALLCIITMHTLRKQSVNVYMGECRLKWVLKGSLHSPWELKLTQLSAATMERTREVVGFG